MNGLQRIIATRPSSYLLELDKNLIQELEATLNQEHKLWTLKSWVNWMVQGDRNTTFYHVFTLVRRNRNWITAIKNSVGEWINNEAEVMEFICRGFCAIYSFSHTSSKWLTSQFQIRQASMHDEERDSLWSRVTDEDIKTGLWSMKVNNAPGSDGLHAGFFQLFWPTIGESVIWEVKQIFALRKMSEYLNRTHIVLIPKIQGLETLGNYRPISFCNTVYKIVTKIIVAHLRPPWRSLSPLSNRLLFLKGKG